MTTKLFGYLVIVSVTKRAKLRDARYAAVLPGAGELAEIGYEQWKQRQKWWNRALLWLFPEDLDGPGWDPVSKLPPYDTRTQKMRWDLPAQPVSYGKPNTGWVQPAETLPNPADLFNGIRLAGEPHYCDFPALDFFSIGAPWTCVRCGREYVAVEISGVRGWDLEETP
jgi:hypothetical protein